MRPLEVVGLLFIVVATGLKIPVSQGAHSKVSASTYRVGAGIYDITGPAAQVGMMGYAMMDQTTAGLHYRLRARAFVIGDSQKRFVYVSTDSCMIFSGIKQHVIQNLQKIYGPTLYDYNNVLLSGTHTHAGPGGYSYYAMYDLTSWGFIGDNFNTIVNGIVQAIQQAHTNYENNKGSRIFINSGELLESNINRSPTAYLANTQEERSKYNYNVDKLMTALRIEDLQGKEIGSINWFAVHGTSMTNKNHLVSGDNKGHASYLFEMWKNGNDSIPGMGPFVAAFGQSNEGDVSPNTKGAFCDDGTPCESVHSTCNGRSQGCNGYGPGRNEFESTEIIGRNQFKKAAELYTTANIPLQGPIDYIHTFIDMENITVSSEFTSTGEVGQTCLAGLGDSFAGGTTDGPGDFNFEQGVNNTHTNEYWNYLASFIFDPTPEQIKCQYPKPILLNTGGTKFPTPWTAGILPLQILRLGQLFIIGVPGEFSTMSGRRLRDTVLKTLISYGAADNNSYVVIAGLSNAYSHYITTFEEYSVQRYEGASTLYGPHTLAAYQQEYSKLAAALATGKRVPPGPTPPDLTGKTPTFLPPVIFDAGSFGSVYQDVAASYERGSTAKVIFYGANPRTDFRTQQTFLTVERQDGSQWKVVKTDSHWETKYFWESHDLAESLITITWDITWDTQPGTYRIKTFGSSKWFGTVTPYEGTSSTFTVF